MIHKFCLVTFLLVSLQSGLPVLAQDTEIEELKKQIDILVEVLREGLELDVSPSFLGINRGRVDSVYLREQGALIEIRTPLANQRNRVSLNALASSIRSFPSRNNPFDRVVRERAAESPQAESRVLSPAAEIATDIERRTVEEVRAVDLQVIIENAIREARSNLRMLRDLDNIEAEELESSEHELDELRQRSRENMDELRQLEDSASGNAAIVGANEAVSVSATADQRLQQLLQALQEMSDDAKLIAAELNLQYQQARAEYRERWQQEVTSFESNMYALLCDYGASLRTLPEDEHVTIVLAGLGAESSEGMPSDKIHVLHIDSLAACQSGDLDAQTLQQRSASYSY